MVRAVSFGEDNVLLAGAELELENAAGLLSQPLSVGTFWTRESHLGQYLQKGLEPELQTASGTRGARQLHSQMECVSNIEY